jgi:hypothetical protein
MQTPTALPTTNFCFHLMCLVLLFMPDLLLSLMISAVKQSLQQYLFDPDGDSSDSSDKDEHEKLHARSGRYFSPMPVLKELDAADFQRNADCQRDGNQDGPVGKSRDIWVAMSGAKECKCCADCSENSSGGADEFQSLLGAMGKKHSLSWSRRGISIIYWMPSLQIGI